MRRCLRIVMLGIWSEKGYRPRRSRFTGCCPRTLAGPPPRHHGLDAAAGPASPGIKGGGDTVHSRSEAEMAAEFWTAIWRSPLVFRRERHGELISGPQRRRAGQEKRDVGSVYPKSGCARTDPGRLCAAGGCSAWRCCGHCLIQSDLMVKAPRRGPNIRITDRSGCSPTGVACCSRGSDSSRSGDLPALARLSTSPVVGDWRLLFGR